MALDRLLCVCHMFRIMLRISNVCECSPQLVHMMFNGFSETSITIERLAVFYKQVVYVFPSRTCMLSRHACSSSAATPY